MDKFVDKAKDDTRKTIVEFINIRAESMKLNAVKSYLSEQLGRDVTEITADMLVSISHDGSNLLSEAFKQSSLLDTQSTPDLRAQAMARTIELSECGMITSKVAYDIMENVIYSNTMSFERDDEYNNKLKDFITKADSAIKEHSKISERMAVADLNEEQKKTLQTIVAIDNFSKNDKESRAFKRTVSDIKKAYNDNPSIGD